MTALLQMLARSGLSLPNPFHAKTRYVRPRRGDNSRDFVYIASDMRKIDHDFRRVAARELDDGRSAYERSRKN